FYLVVFVIAHYFYFKLDLKFVTKIISYNIKET
ncbi:hypothetical protein LCGC14_0908750, partial [marine sediment metagenome]